MKKYINVLGLVALCFLASNSSVRAEGEADGSTPLSGTVAETMDGGRYTYLRVTSGEASHWVAATQMKVAVGDSVTVMGGTLMKNFESPTLKRTFDSILFAEEVRVGDGAAKEEKSLPPGHPPVSGHGGMSQALNVQAGISGEVLETMDTGNYTYLQIRGEDRTVWAATERMAIKVGERVTIPSSMVMKNFESPTLGRTFDEIYFTDKVVKEGEDASGLPAGHPAVASPAPAAAAVEVIAQPEGGISVADLYAQRAELVGREVVVKGKVVSYTERVMGRNWIHLADGTGTDDSRELTVNTTGTTRLGAIITVKGVVAVDENLGHGYQYVVLLKDAVLTNE